MINKLKYDTELYKPMPINEFNQKKDEYSNKLSGLTVNTQFELDLKQFFQLVIENRNRKYFNFLITIDSSNKNTLTLHTSDNIDCFYEGDKLYQFVQSPTGGLLNFQKMVSPFPLSTVYGNLKTHYVGSTLYSQINNELGNNDSFIVSYTTEDIENYISVISKLFFANPDYQSFGKLTFTMILVDKEDSSGSINKQSSFAAHVHFKDSSGTETPEPEPLSIYNMATLRP